MVYVLSEEDIEMAVANDIVEKEKSKKKKKKKNTVSKYIEIYFNIQYMRIR